MELESGFGAYHYEIEGWTLKAYLTGEIANQKGVSISVTNGVVKENTNDGILDEVPAGLVSGNASIEITKDGADVMVGNSDVIHNAVYDYELGNVNWNLEKAAQP